MSSGYSVRNSRSLFLFMDKVKAIFRRVIWEAVMLSAASLLFMFFAGQYVAPLFVKPEDTELLKVSIIGMKLFSLSYLTG